MEKITFEPRVFLAVSLIPVAIVWLMQKKNHQSATLK
jgi:hypothetical protein